MNFHATIHPFQMTSRYPDNNSFFASLVNRKSLLNSIRTQMKWEIGSPHISSEQGQCVGYYNIERNNFLGDIQEYAAGLDHGNLESIYMGMEQTRFNHLIEIRNNIGIYLPVFFFFPIRISIKQNALPIFVGSAIKLQSELKEINTTLHAQDHVTITDLKNTFEASEEDMEDYEASHEGTENFWPGFTYIILEKLIRMSIQSRLPMFIF